MPYNESGNWVDSTGYEGTYAGAPAPAPAPTPTRAPAPAPVPAPGGMLSQAPAPAPTPNPQQSMLAGWFDDYMKSNPKAQGYTAAQAGTTNWNVDRNQTVQGQLQGMLAKGSPLMTQAQTRANQGMARRGLMNSSMAVGAAQGALYDVAVPIATSDASMYGRAGETNANNANTNSRFNAGETNAAGRFGADANNQALFQQRGAGIQGAMQGQEQAWQSGENAAQRGWGTSERIGGQDFAARESMLGRDFTGSENQKGRDFTSGENAANRTFTTNERLAGQDYTAGENRLNRNFTTEERISGQQFTASQTAVTQAFQMQFQAADQAGKVALANIDGDIRQNVADITGRYNLQMQGSQSMSTTFNAMNNGIAAILTDDTLDWAGKQAAINGLMDATNNTLAIQSTLLGIDLGNLDSTAISGVDLSGRGHVQDDLNAIAGVGSGAIFGGGGGGAGTTGGGPDSGGGDTSSSAGDNANGDAAGVGTGPMAYDVYGNPAARR